MTAPAERPPDPALAAQDPAELFDVVHADGAPTGRTKRRDEVHRDGDWHRSLHVWLVGVDPAGRAVLTFQRRGRLKDTSPLHLDATVGGHYRAGETLAETLRETEEEIGLVVAERDLLFAGVRQAASERDGTLDREVQDVYLLRDDRPLTALRPNPAELDALVRVTVADLIALYAPGGPDAVDGENLDAKTGTVSTCAVRLPDLLPSVDRYPLKVALAARALLRGDEQIAV